MARKLPVGHHGGVRRIALALASVALAGCGGSGGEREAPPDRTDFGSRVVKGEVRTPDARSPFVRGKGLWRCETTGRIDMRVSPDGLASLFVRGRLLASVAPTRALINRSCTAQRPARLPPFRAPRTVVGESYVRCAVPQAVLIDMRDGDLTVRATHGGRFLLGAAVSERHFEPTGHWSVSCTVL
jgi:hypothetical protein